MEWWQRLSNKAKAVAAISAAVTTISGGATGFHHVYAKEAAFQSHMAEHKKQDIKKRISVLEEQMLEYRSLFEDKLEKATMSQKKRYKSWEIEVELLWKELELKT